MTTTAWRYPTEVFQIAATGTKDWENVIDTALQTGDDVSVRRHVTDNGAFVFYSLCAQGYGFTIPSNATISSVKIAIDRYLEYGPANVTDVDNGLDLVLQSDTTLTYPTTAIVTGSDISTTRETVYLNDPSWEVNLTPNMINDPLFTFFTRIEKTVADNLDLKLHIYSIGIQVTYITSSPPSGTYNTGYHWPGQVYQTNDSGSTEAWANVSDTQLDLNTNHINFDHSGLQTDVARTVCCYDYGFSIPSDATINSLTLMFVWQEKYTYSAGSYPAYDTKSGVGVYTEATVIATPSTLVWPTTNILTGESMPTSTSNYDPATEEVVDTTWDVTLTPTMINNANFTTFSKIERPQEFAFEYFNIRVYEIKVNVNYTIPNTGGANLLKYGTV